MALGPVVGCTVVFACAGWATFAPVGAFRFAKSLAIVFVMSLPLWFFLASMQFTPRRIKSVEHPAMYPSEFMVIAGPPVLAAAMLTAVRARKESAALIRQDSAG